MTPRTRNCLTVAILLTIAVLLVVVQNGLEAKHEADEAGRAGHAVAQEVERE